MWAFSNSYTRCRLWQPTHFPKIEPWGRWCSLWSFSCTSFKLFCGPLRTNWRHTIANAAPHRCSKRWRLAFSAKLAPQRLPIQQMLCTLRQIHLHTELVLNDVGWPPWPRKRSKTSYQTSQWQNSACSLGFIPLETKAQKVSRFWDWKIVFTKNNRTSISKKGSTDCLCAGKDWIATLLRWLPQAQYHNKTSLVSGTSNKWRHRLCGQSCSWFHLRR